jgi:hypothetical protein
LGFWGDIDWREILATIGSRQPMRNLPCRGINVITIIIVVEKGGRRMQNVSAIPDEVGPRRRRRDEDEDEEFIQYL